MRSEVQIFPDPPLLRDTALAGFSFIVNKLRTRLPCLAQELEWRRHEIGAIAQMGERLICIQEVGGSIPPGSTIVQKYRKVAEKQIITGFH